MNIIKHDTQTQTKEVRLGDLALGTVFEAFEEFGDGILPGVFMRTSRSQMVRLGADPTGCVPSGRVYDVSEVISHGNNIVIYASGDVELHLTRGRRA